MFRSLRYRYDNEHIVLVMTILLVLAVIILTSTVTFCVSGIFILLMFALSAMMINSHHRALMRSALPINAHQESDLADVVNECTLKLQPGEVDVFLVKKDLLNAYTFGIGSPKVLVLYYPLLEVMSAGELKFIIGHEMGHVALGHTWLNTIIGGLAGIPAPFGAAVLLYTSFKWWSRMCEFSADRAGLLACGDLNLAISALVMLVAPEARSQVEFERAFTLIDAEDDDVSNRLAETFQSHPLLIRRINQLRDYARTKEYQDLQAGVNRNVGGISRSSTQREMKPDMTQSAPEMEEASELPPEERWPWLKRED